MVTDSKHCSAVYDSIEKVDRMEKRGPEWERSWKRWDEDSVFLLSPVPLPVRQLASSNAVKRKSWRLQRAYNDLSGFQLCSQKLNSSLSPVTSFFCFFCHHIWDHFRYKKIKITNSNCNAEKQIFLWIKKSFRPGWQVKNWLILGVLWWFIDKFVELV